MDDDKHESVIQTRLRIRLENGRTVPSLPVLRLLGRSFRGLAQVLCSQFERELGQTFRTIDIREIPSHESSREFSRTVEVRVESSRLAASGLAYQWLIAAGNWVQETTRTFPELRGAISVGVDRAADVPPKAALLESHRGAA